MTDTDELRRLRATADRLQTEALQAHRAAAEATRRYRDAVQAFCDAAQLQGLGADGMLPDRIEGEI